LARPIPSRKLRRITFISTRLDLLLAAGEINDLWEKERRQDELWAALRSHQIEAEREVLIRERGAGPSLVGAGFSRPGPRSPRPYVADFLVPCPGGPVIVICAARQSAVGENVLYLQDEELSDTHGCVRRIQQAMERARRKLADLPKSS
jgi:hypothetical protein